jgi:catechol 2,3-dioxygenase-like lactoylglutathione lyase family enzyme
VARPERWVRAPDERGGDGLLTGLAHSAICVPDVEEATRWYSTVLGLEVLSPPYLMSGDDIERDMGELVPGPVTVKAAILGFGPDDRVLELIEYPHLGRDADRSWAADITMPGLTHVGLTCDDVVATRATLEERGVRFLTAGIADIAGLRSTWFADPWGVVFIVLEKAHGDRPYWGQPVAPHRPRRSA